MAELKEVSRTLHDNCDLNRWTDFQQPAAKACYEATGTAHHSQVYCTGLSAVQAASTYVCVQVVSTLKPDKFEPKIVAETGEYLYVEYKSPLLGFVDDGKSIKLALTAPYRPSHDDQPGLLLPLPPPQNMQISHSLQGNGISLQLSRTTHDQTSLATLNRMSCVAVEFYFSGRNDEVSTLFTQTRARAACTVFLPQQPLRG